MYKTQLKYPGDPQINLKSMRALCFSIQDYQHGAYLQRYLDIEHSALQLLHVWMLGSAVGFPTLSWAAKLIVGCLGICPHKGIHKRPFNGQQMLHMAQRNCQGHTFKYYIHPKAQLPYSGLYEVFASMPLHLRNPLLSRKTSVFSFTKSSTKLFLSCMGFHCHPSQYKELTEHSSGGLGPIPFSAEIQTSLSHIS